MSVAGGWLTIDSMASNEVRIISGKWKGRKLRFPASAGLRPTLGRARGSLFNWLAADIQDATCLDLYAGSGALGFEALSRGAASAVFVERNRQVAAALQRSAALLGANAQIVVAPAMRFLGTACGQWQLIFLDPPFESNELDAVLDVIAARDLLAPGGCIYLERPRKELLFAGRPAPEVAADRNGWRMFKRGHAGDSQFGLLARE